jgi:hypothetical protein
MALTPYLRVVFATVANKIMYCLATVSVCALIQQRSTHLVRKHNHDRGTLEEDGLDREEDQRDIDNPEQRQQPDHPDVELAGDVR